MGKEIIVRPHILSNRERRVEDIDFGMTIQEMVDRIPGLDDRVRQTNLAVLIDGEAIPRAEWDERCVEKTDKQIEVAVVLSGSGSGNDKQIMALVATVILMVVAPAAGAAMTGTGGILAGTGISASVVTAGIVMVGSLAISAIFKPPTIDGSESAPSYGFGNQTNQARPFGRIPRIYGEHRFVPDVVAMPYTINVGDDQFLYVVYSFGYAPLKLRDFRIGENPITNYSDVEMLVHENFTDPSQLKIYTSDVWQDSLSFELTSVGGPQILVTQENTTRAIIDLAYPMGLGKRHADDGEEQPTLDKTLIEYRAFQAVPADTWKPADIVDASRGYLAANSTGVLSGLVETFSDGYNEATSNGYGADPVGDGRTFTVVWDPVGGPPPPGTMLEFTGGTTGFYGGGSFGVDSPTVYEVASATANSVTFTEGFRLRFSGSSTQFRYASALNGPAGQWNIGGFFDTGFAAGITVAFPTAGQWELRITKLNADHPGGGDEAEWLLKRYIVALKSMSGRPPINPPVPITVVELKIKATGQLNGTVQAFNAVATSVLRAWQGGAWVDKETRNPAWIYLDVLTGTANMRPTPDHRIDMDKLREWAVKNDTVNAGFSEVLGTCDYVVYQDMTVWQMLQSVATTGRAAPTMRDNKFSVLIDEADRTPVQMFTSRNSWGLKSRRTYVDEPHALRVKWVDPAMDYGPAEIIVYNTGYDINNATVFEEIQSFGMTRPEQVTRWGRYMLAQGKLRQERFTIQTDIEHVVCLRGDVVLVAHDVIQVGGDASRITAVDGAILYLDSPPILNDIPAASAGIRVRKNNGTLTEVIDIVAYDDDSVTVANVADLAGVSPDQLLVMGPKTSVTEQYVVDFVRPNSEMNATIGLEEFAPGVYTAESAGVIPPYTPPGGGRGPVPAVANLTAVLVEFNRRNKPFARVELRWGLPDIPGFRRARSFRVVEVKDGGAEEVLTNTEAFGYNTPGLALRSVAGQTRTYAVRADYGLKGFSIWKRVSVTFPARAVVPPKEADSFTVTNLTAERRRYSWTWVNDFKEEEIAGVRIRYVAGNVIDPDWATMTDLMPGGATITQSGIELNRPVGAGTYTFLLRTVDDTGALSVTGLRTVAVLTTEATGNDTTPPPTPTGFTATGGYGIVTFTVDNPAYAMGGGHGYTQVYGAIHNAGDPLPGFPDATPFASFTGAMGAAGAAAGTTYRFWAKWVSKDGGISDNPAGGVNGDEAITAINVPATLEAIEGMLDATHLHTSLGTRIDLIDAASGVAGSVNARVLAEANARTDAIAAEAAARGTAITNEANTRIAEDNALAQQITTLTAVSGGGFDTAAIWPFDTSVEGWVAVGANTAVAAQAGGFLRMSGAGAGGQMGVRSPAGLAIDGSLYKIIRARVTRVAGAGWGTGNAYYTTAGHGEVSTFHKTLANPNLAVGQTAILEWDMGQLTNGGTDWSTSTITKIRLDIGNTAADVFDVDWIGVGRPTPAASLAALQTEQTTRATADTANANNITALTSRVTTAEGDINTVEANLVTEQNTRATADTANANNITALTSRVTTAEGDINTVEANLVTEQNTRATADTAIATDVTVLSAKVDNTSDAIQAWNFDNDEEGFIGLNCTVARVSVGGNAFALRQNAPTSGNHGVHTPSFTPFRGRAFNKIRARIRRQAGSGWDGTVFFTNGTHGFDPDYTETIADPGTPIGTWVVAEWDMASLTAGGSDWVVSPDISRLRIDLGSTLADEFDISWVSINRTSAGGGSAFLIEEQTVRAAADTAIATDVTTLFSKVTSRPNLLQNGGFEQGADYWTFNSNAASPYALTLAGWGPVYHKTNPVGGGNIASDMVSVSTGIVYTLSADYRLNISAGAVASAWLSIRWFDSSGVLISTSTGPIGGERTVFATSNVGRDLIAFSAEAPVGATQAQIRFNWSLTSGTITWVGARQIKFERGDMPYTPYSQEVALQVMATVADGLEAQYTVKIDNNGYVSGFGLASTPVNGTPFAVFEIRADAFRIASTSGTTPAPASPFTVFTTATTVNGVSVPAGVYMTSAFIHTAMITSAMINSLAASKITAASLSAITATIGVLRTAATGARMEIRDNVVKIYDTGNVLRVQLGDLTL